MRVFLSFNSVLPSCLPFLWHILQRFIIPQTVRSSFYTKAWDAHYRVPKMTGQSCGGDKSYKAAWYLLDVLEVQLVFYKFWTRTVGDFFILDEFKWCLVFVPMCHSVPRIQGQNSTVWKCQREPDILMIKIMKMNGIWVCCSISTSAFLQVFLLTRCALGLLKFSFSP